MYLTGKYRHKCEVLLATRSDVDFLVSMFDHLAEVALKLLFALFRPNDLI